MERLTGQAWPGPDLGTAGFPSLWRFAPVSWVAKAGELLRVTGLTNSRDGCSRLLFGFQPQAQASVLTFSCRVQASFPGRTLPILPPESRPAGGQSEGRVPGSPPRRAASEGLEQSVVSAFPGFFGNSRGHPRGRMRSGLPGAVTSAPGPTHPAFGAWALAAGR